MDTADRLGLLPGFGWIAGHNYFFTLLICWLLTPIAMVLIAPVFEGRKLPLIGDKQFLSFFPGDLFLGVMAAGLLRGAQSLPAGSHWYNALWWHLVVLIAAAGVAAKMTYDELHGNIYSPRAVYSPTKLYHNVLLYVGYGYVIVTSLVADLAGARNWWLLTLIAGVVWLWLLRLDSSDGVEGIRRKARTAHVPDWHPFWVH